MNSNVLSTPASKASKTLLVAGFVLAGIGFLDASYLTAEHYLNAIPPCSILEGCETVLTSEYATLLGIPVALFGALYYVTAFMMILFYKETLSEKILFVFLGISLTALLASLGFVYIQLFILRAICLYCMASALTSTLLFAVAAALFIKRKKPVISR